MMKKAGHLVFTRLNLSGSYMSFVPPATKTIHAIALRQQHHFSTTPLFHKHQKAPTEAKTADSKDAKPRKIQTDTPVLRSLCARLLSEGHTDIKKIAEEICGEISGTCRLWTSNVEFKVETVEEKIRNLIEVGCTLTQVLENPSVLRYGKKEIEGRVRKLVTEKQLVNVHSIIGTHSKSSKHFLKFNEIFRGKSWVENLSEKLECSISELLQETGAMSHILCSKYPDRILEKIDVLLGLGFSSSEIRGCMRVLNKDVETLRRRVELIRELGLEKLVTLSWLLQGEAKFNKIVNNAKRYVLWGDKWEYVSKLLEIPVDEVRQRFKRISMENIIPKLEVLIEFGFTGQEILNRPKLMRISEKNIRTVLELAMKNELHDLDVLQRYAWLVNLIPSFHHGGYSQKSILSKLLKCSKKSIGKNAHFLKQALSYSDSTILESINILNRNGFSNSDIEQCPLVLNHDPSLLKIYVSSLESRRELQPYSEWENDKVKLLNVLQYLIEKDMNFSCSGCLVKKEQADVPGRISEADLLNEVD